jgi:hypothetical protein
MAQVSSAIIEPQRLAPYTIRDANFDLEAGEIIRLCKAGGLHSSIEKYRWKYESCTGQRPLCKFAIDTASGRPIGTTSLFPRRLLIDGTAFSAAIAGDFAVDARHRTLLPAMSLQKSALQASREGRFDVIYGFPNDAARLVQLRAGYTSIGAVRAGIRSLHSRRLFESPEERRWWGAFADMFDVMLRIVSKGSHHLERSDYSYSEHATLDERFDQFWTRALPHYPIVVERNSHYMNWRFMQCPYKTYRLFAASHRQTGEIDGYILWSVAADGKVRIFDLMASEQVFDGLLTAFIRSQQERDAPCITLIYFGNDSLVRRLRSFGFFFRQTRSQVLLSVNPRLPNSQRLFKAQNWYLLEGDSDT